MNTVSLMDRPYTAPARGRRRGVSWMAALVAAVAGLALTSSVLAAPPGTSPYPVPVSAYQALHWRSIGPFRGGRTTAVAGIADQPYTFYIGSSGGGVWKTESAGLSWHNVSDGFFKRGSIGAIAVAPSNPNVIYVGTGEASVRIHSTSPGDGVYKSTDAGKTWSWIGLKHTMHISAIAIDPENANIVYVGAQGDPWKPSEQRGVFRSLNGGKTWQRVLFVNETTGVHSISIDPKDPNVLYASTWDYRVKPWFYRSGGPGSGLWKSTDGGTHWKRLVNGLPKLMGNTAISVSPADPNRVYAMIGAVHGGVFRSDNAGETWERVNSDPAFRARAWYYTLIYADPTQKNTVYVLGNSWGRSTNGGKTFTTMHVPHGDNHALWINPTNDHIMVEGNDGGGTVSLDDGRTWSTELNQPTGQFYRVFADNGFPYRLYGGQQDREALSIPNRTFGFGIGASEVRPAAGGESAQISMDANDPEFVYGTGLLGSVTVYNQKTGTMRNISPWPNWSGYRNADQVKYRFSWTPPIAVSQQHPNTVYVGAQVVLRTTDDGATWQAISPDLTRDDKARQGTPSGPIQYGGGAGYWSYGELTYIELSPIAPGTIWVGSDDGQVHVTKDGGKHWANVTPAGLGDSYVHSIEASPQDPARAYVVANRYRFGDQRPMIYMTNNYGRSWTLEVNGIPSDDFAEVVREDPTKANILYAGTLTGVFVSFNNGKLWQPLQQNLPAVPVTDLKVRKDDLVISTQGRGFWVLDDLTPLYQLDSKVLRANMYLYKPRLTHRTAFSFSGGGGPFGENPPNGVVFHYNLHNALSSDGKPLTLEVLTSNGKVIRRFTSAPTIRRQALVEKGVEMAPPALPLPTKAGMNAYVWNLRVAPYVATADVFRNVSQIPYRVAPGQYEVRLTYGGESQTQSFTIAGDPRRAKRSPSEWDQQQSMLANLRSLVNDINRANNDMRWIALQVQGSAAKAAVTDKSAARTLTASAQAVVRSVACWEQQYKQPRLSNDTQDYVSYPSRSWAIPVFNLISLVDRNPPPITKRDELVARELTGKWSSFEAAERSIVSVPLARFNVNARHAGLQPVELHPRPDSTPPPPVIRVTPGECSRSSTRDS